MIYIILLYIIIIIIYNTKFWYLIHVFLILRQIRVLPSHFQMENLYFQYYFSDAIGQSVIFHHDR